METLPNVIAISTILRNETTIAVLISNKYNATITIKFASPSFIPGMPKFIGISVSMKPITIASAVSMPTVAILCIYVEDSLIT
jgi:hypothetical protein